MAAGSTPIFVHHTRYSDGRISDGLISLRPPQKTFVYSTGIPASSRWRSIAALWASTRSFSVPWATAMTFTLATALAPVGVREDVMAADFAPRFELPAFRNAPVKERVVPRDPRSGL
jgi:hypothetical protein